MMKVNEFITNGQSHNDDRFLAEVIEKFNEVILFASDGDLHLTLTENTVRFLFYPEFVR